MKIKIYFTLLVTTALLTSCSKPAADQPAEKPSAEEPSAKPAEMTVKLDADAQKRIGLEVANPVATEWQREIRANGRVLDPAPLQELLMDFFRAELTFDTSHQELERAKQLKKDNNISERAFQDAEATYRQNFAAVSAARFKIESAWGNRIAEMTGKIVVPPGTPRKLDMGLDKLTSPGTLIRIDLATGERLPFPHSAHIVPLAKRELPITASFFDNLPVMDAQTQQQGLLFVNDQPNTLDRLTPGEAVTAFIKSSDAPVSGVKVPASAILRHEGKGWIYLQTGTNVFTRQEISLDRPTDGGFFSAELSATNRVVVTGAQTVLSAELSGGGFNAGQRD